MTSTLISNPVTDASRKRRDKKKKSLEAIEQAQKQNTVTPWKSEAQQQVYSTKLLQALRQVRIGSSPSAVPKRGRAVREAADRVLAATAKGRTRWSRAILSNRLKMKFMKNKRPRITGTVDNTRSKKKQRVCILRLKTKNMPAVQRKARALGRLVPGCRKQPLPVVLEEATDYIAALEMQVRAMAALTEMLSGTGSLAGPS